MSNTVQGNNPLSYQGVRAGNPPNLRVLKRPPNSTDSKNVNIGDFWLDSVGKVLYQAVNLEKDVATWNAVITSNASGSTINTAGQLLLQSSQALGTAVMISASNPAGGVRISAQNGGLSLTSTTGIGLGAPSGLTISNGIDPSVQIKTGATNPNGVVAALRGSLFIRSDTGVAATTLYVNTDGAMAWTALT